ncbi:uncharacterized protein LOC114175441 [Vigna unguiculata]|uniref:uncharacterized protein LOC114175441 n=1 Tax=Vigna unguiculata TaxID=3917 RepID=UPI001016F000|nr:uncharacterized protein LOC114175441 [Vigna unguiculata]
MIRSWFVPDFSKQRCPFSMELVIQDKETEISEGHVYAIQNFSVAPNSGIYRTTHHPYKINFQFGTKVSLLHGNLVPDMKPQYTPLSLLTTTGFDTDYLVDKVQVQNCKFYTRIKYNVNFNEASELKSRMFENNESPFQGLTQLSQTSKHTVEEEFLTLTPRTTIQGLKDCKEVTTYILLGTIKHILGEDDWWYTACLCNKAVYPDSKIYRIKIRVIDSSNPTTFMLFDRDATTIFKKSCADMLETHDKMNASGNLPKEFDQLVDKSLLFKVESRNDHTFKLEQSFRVKKVCVDDDIIQKFNDSSMKSVDVYAGNDEFSRQKQHVVNESTVDIAEDLLVIFTKETIECGSQSPDLIKDNATNDDGNSSLKREFAKKTASFESIEEDSVPLKLLKRNIKKEKSVI